MNPPKNPRESERPETPRHVQVAIIGAGTAGLSARREVARKTEDYVVIDDGILGTTCARVGCMPSKVLIQVAADYHRRHKLREQGVLGGDQLKVDGAAVMRHVRTLRDRFVRGVLGSMHSWESKLIRKRATFVDAHTLRLRAKDDTAPGKLNSGELLTADRIIIATGSTPVVPKAWEHVAHRLIDTDNFFERETLPESIVIVGLGVVGLELGQALARLGVRVVGVSLDMAYGGLTDPTLQAYAHAGFQKEFPVHLHAVEQLDERDGQLHVTLADGTSFDVEAVLVTMGRRPQVADLELEAAAKRSSLTISMSRGIPAFSSGTFRVQDTPWYLTGDMNGERPVLHEAADEGRIAGYNAVRDEAQCFRRRTSMGVTFSEPNIAVIGESFQALNVRGAQFVTGEASYEGQGRAIVKLKEHGLLHVYVSQATGHILGAELIAPEGEHLAHLIAWSISTESTVRDTLSFPFYHPVLEEGLRTAFRSAAIQLEGREATLETLRCGEELESFRYKH